jgi:multiple sugar transport system substrate-binding protein
MNNPLIRRIVCLAASSLMITFLLNGCSEQTSNTIQTQSPTNTAELADTMNSDISQKTEKPTNILRFYHFNNEEAPALKEAFEAAHPNVTVELQINADTNGSYNTFLTSFIRSGMEVPDVYAVELAFLKRFANLDNAFEDLSSAPYNAEELKTKLAPFTIDMGRDNDGKIRALSHQACAGAIGYKREMAKKYLSTDDPNEIGEMFSTPEKIIETAITLKERSGGKAKIFPGLNDLMRIYLGGRSQGWIVDNKLIVDPKVKEFVTLAKKLNDLGTLGSLDAWTPQWSAAIQDDVNFAYAIPTWGIPWIIDVNQIESKKNTGDWGLAKAPAPYVWGGTWFGIYKESKNKELAWEFIKFITANEAQSVAWAKHSGDFVSNLAAIDTLSKDNTLINKTVNQNPYEFFKPMINDINGSLLTEYDDQTVNPFLDTMKLFLSGKITEDQMWIQWKNQLKKDLPDLTIE